MFCLALELTVAIFPLIARWNRFERIPVLGDATLFNAEEVINASGYATKRSLGDDEDEVTLAKYLVHAFVYDRLTFGGKSLQARKQPRDCIGHPGVVLNVLGSVEVPREGLPTPCEKVLHIALHERIIGLRLIQIGGDCGTVDHRVSARAGFGRRLLQIIPMLDDQAIFEPEDVESDAWSEEVVLRVSEDIIAIFKDADRIDGRIGRHVLDEGGDACRARPDLQVVLDVFIRIDICERNRISGLKRLQEIDDLLFTAGRHGSSRTSSHCNNGPFGPLFASLRGELSDNVAMGRRNLFTREAVLNKTIPVFWKHGLAETSVQDLEQATGVRKSGLYAEFKDKEDVFVASMRQYFDVLRARGALTKQPLGWDNVEGFLKVCYGSWGRKGCFSVNSMREFADLPPQARRIMIANMTKAHQLLIGNLAAARGGTDENESLADLIITFFCGICLEQNLSPDRSQITKKIEAFMELIRGKG